MKDEIDDALQHFGWAIELFERGARGAMSVDGFLARLVDSIQRRICRFARLHVFARSLAEVGGGGGYVEQVVGNLKQQPEMRPVRSDSFQFVFVRAADDRAATRHAND